MDDQLEPQPGVMAEEAVAAAQSERVGTVAEQPRIGVAETASEDFAPRVGVADPAVEAATPAQPIDLTQRVASQPVNLTQAVQTQPAQPLLERSAPVQMPIAAQPVDMTQAIGAQPSSLFQPRLGMAAAAQVPSQTLAVPQPQMQRQTAATPATRASATQPSGQSAGGGSAGAGFQVDPALYQAAISPVLAAADQVSQLVTNLTGFLSGMEANAPWGNDESGKKFAEGDKGYLKYSADTQKALKDMPDGLHYIADGLKAMVDGYQNAEDSVISQLDQQDAQLQQDAVMPKSPNIPASPMLPIPPRATLGDIARGSNR